MVDASHEFVFLGFRQRNEDVLGNVTVEYQGKVVEKLFSVNYFKDKLEVLISPDVDEVCSEQVLEYFEFSLFNCDEESSAINHGISGSGVGVNIGHLAFLNSQGLSDVETRLDDAMQKFNHGLLGYILCEEHKQGDGPQTVGVVSNLNKGHVVIFALVKRDSSQVD